MTWVVEGKRDFIFQFTQQEVLEIAGKLLVSVLQ